MRDARTEGRITLEKLFLGLSALSLLFLVVLTVIDILGRNLLRAPIPASYELTMLAMGVLVFSGLPFVTRDDSHIRVDLVDKVVARRRAVKQAYSLALCLCGLLGSLIIFVALANQVMSMHQWGNRTFYFNWPLWPFAAFMCVVSGINAIIYIPLIRQVFQASPEPPTAEEDERR